MEFMRSVNWLNFTFVEKHSYLSRKIRLRYTGRNKEGRTFGCKTSHFLGQCIPSKRSHWPVGNIVININFWWFSIVPAVLTYHYISELGYIAKDILPVNFCWEMFFNDVKFIINI